MTLGQFVQAIDALPEELHHLDYTLHIRLATLGTDLLFLVHPDVLPMVWNTRHPGWEFLDHRQVSGTLRAAADELKRNPE